MINKHEEAEVPWVEVIEETRFFQKLERWRQSPWNQSCKALSLTK